MGNYLQTSDDGLQPSSTIKIPSSMCRCATHALTLNPGLVNGKELLGPWLGGSDILQLRAFCHNLVGFQVYIHIGFMVLLARQ